MRFMITAAPDPNRPKSASDAPPSEDIREEMMKIVKEAAPTWSATFEKKT